MKGAQQLTAHELLIVRSLIILAEKRYLHSTDSDNHGRTMQRLDKRRHDHGARKYAVRYGPHSNQRRFVFLNFEHERCDACWWTASEFWAFILRAFDNKGKKNRHDERDDGESNQRHAPDASNLAGHVFGIFYLCRGIVSKVDFTNPSSAVEEKREPP